MHLNNNIKFREADKILRKNGFNYDKTKGSHIHYKRNGIRVVITKDLNPCVWQRLCKENKLKLN